MLRVVSCSFFLRSFWVFPWPDIFPVLVRVRSSGSVDDSRYCSLSSGKEREKPCYEGLPILFPRSLALLIT